MRLDQGNWVTCRKFQFLFSYTPLSHNSKLLFILMQTPLHLNIWLQSYEEYFNAENNIQQENVNTVFASISKTISLTSNSSLSIMSHMLFFWHSSVVYMKPLIHRSRKLTVKVVVCYNKVCMLFVLILFGHTSRALILMTQLRVRFWFNLGDLSIFFIDGAV